MTIENAKITNTHLGFEDHGILTAYIAIQGDHWGQSFGGYGLSPSNGNHMAVFINETLKTVGVEKWEDLKDKPIRVDHEFNNLKAIGHIIEDKWFNIKEKFNSTE